MLEPIKYLKKYWLYGVVMLLVLPALLIHLNMIAFIDDEAIRALVAFEMYQSGDYLAPTLNDVAYYRKPPLYNWILLLFFRAFGYFGELPTRFATVVFLLGYAATVYYFFKKELNKKTAFLLAMFLITCGRILFWDSMLGLIDMFFSWVMFVLFMVVYRSYKRKNWYLLFSLSWGLTAVGFLLKGLPALAFQVITLFAFFWWRKELKRLFTLPNIVGGLLFLVLAGSYYVAYAQSHDIERLFRTILSESTQRTVTHYGWKDTVLHLFTFPFEMLYHFLPWSLFSIYLWDRHLLQKIRQHDFISYCFLIFLANVLLYWSSVEVYPRYLLMLAPLLFGGYLYLHGIHRAANTWQYRTLMYVLPLILGILLLGSVLPLLLPRTASTPYLWWKCLFLLLVSIGLSKAFFKYKEKRLLVLVAALLVVRIGFNWFVLPDRLVNDWGSEVRSDAHRIGQKYQGQPLYIYQHSNVRPTGAFYLSQAYQAQVKRRFDNVQLNAVYIIDQEKYPDALKWQLLDSLKIRDGKRIIQVGIPEKATQSD